MSRRLRAVGATRRSIARQARPLAVCAFRPGLRVSACEDIAGRSVSKQEIIVSYLTNFWSWDALVNLIHVFRFTKE